MSSRTIYTIACCAVSLWNASPATPAEFYGLGQLSGGEFTAAADLSSDGSVLVGSTSTDAEYRWTVEGGFEPLSCGGGDSNCQAIAVSADGKVAVGTKNTDTAVSPVRWADASTIEELEILPGYTGCRPLDVSGDGSVVVGNCWSESQLWMAVRWTHDGVESLGIPDPFTTTASQGRKVSSDGSVVLVGGIFLSGFEFDDSAWLWTEQSGYEYVARGISLSMTPDGSVVVGDGMPDEDWTFRWSKETGMEKLQPKDSLVGPSVSSDGSVIFAKEWIERPNTTRPIVRFDDGEVRGLRELLISDYDLASELQGWELEGVKATSVDGRTILGRGYNQDGERESWMAVLDPSLQAGDADQDFDFDQLDLVAVQVAGKYLTGEPATWGEGDWNGAPVLFTTTPPEGDGLFNQLDIVAAQQAGLYMTGSYASTRADTFVAVPEPTGLMLAVAGLLVLVLRRYRFGNSE